MFKFKNLIKRSQHKSILSLLNKIKSFDKNYKINNYDKSEINILTKLIKDIKEQNINELLHFWEEALKKDYFELPHPEISDLNTRAVYNIQVEMTNFVFMMDKKGENPWLFAQCENIIEIIITNNNSYKISANISPALGHMKQFIKKDFPKFDFDTRFEGFLLNQTRPYHFLYDHYIYFIHLGGSKKLLKYNKTIDNNKSFFISSEDSTLKKRNGVYLFPATIGRNHIKQKSEIKQLELNMEEYITKDSLLTKAYDENDSSQWDLTMWFGIIGQKRAWIEQVENCIKIVNTLLPYFPKIKIFIDGMTASENMNIKSIEDEAIFKKIYRELNCKCEVISTIGLDYRKKIQLSEKVDFFIVNGGSGCMVPKITKQACIMHSTNLLWTFGKEDNKLVKYTEKSMTYDIRNIDNKVTFTSYIIPWQHVFNLVADILEEIKDIKIKRLDVPALELVVKEYDNKLELEDKELLIYKNLRSRINDKCDSADILKEVALALEKDGEIHSALVLMNKALKLRPTGPIIQKKIEEYEEILSKIKS
jgi:hypothetical protein